MDGWMTDDGCVDGPANAREIAIDKKDIKGSELDPFLAGGEAEAEARRRWEAALVVHQDASREADVETADDVPRQESRPADWEQTPGVQEREPQKQRVDDERLAHDMAYTNEDWWWTPQQTAKSELTVQEQAAVLTVVVSGLAVLALVVAAVWNLLAFSWRSIREHRLMSRLFSERDPDRLDEGIKAFPIKSSLLIKHVASIRLRHLRVVTNACTFTEQLESVVFDEDTLDLSPLPEHPTTFKPMTFSDILSRVEEISCTGDLVAGELMQLVVPPQCIGYVDLKMWKQANDDSIQALQRQAARIHEMSSRLGDVLMAKMDSGEVIGKPKFMALVAALRQNTAKTNNNEPSYRQWSTSSMTSDNGKDELSFLLKKYEEVDEQQKIKAELHEAIETYNKSAAEHHQGELIRAEESRNGGNARPHMISNTVNTLVTRKLERFVDRAEVLEMTHVEEVEHAQCMLEDARRDNFCASIVNRDSKDFDNVQVLARNFVDMGAERKDAILKAGEIVANRSNTMILVNSLRGMFDELRKRDIIKMNEKRQRDQQKASEKRDRMTQKFKYKQQLIAEKIEQARLAQKQKEEEERQRRLEVERQEWLLQRREERSDFVWRITKIDVLIVLVVMAIVFFENLRQLAFVKPLCSPDDEKKWWMISWWTPDSLSVFSCELAYGAKIVGILLALGLVFFVFAQLNIVVAVLPIVGAAVLFYLRAEWMNMLLRLPLLLVIYAFNSAVLYGANRGEEHPHFHAHKRRALLYLLFPVASLALTMVTSVAIACDDPEQCVEDAYDTAVPVLEGLWTMVRGAYRL
jgi:hypothetical protein